MDEEEQEEQDKQKKREGTKIADITGLLPRFERIDFAVITRNNRPLVLLMYKRFGCRPHFAAAVERVSE